jgi:phage-related protein
MPEMRVVAYREENGAIPLIDWLGELAPKKARAKCLYLIELLRQEGYDLRRPHADILRDGIHELRTHLGHVQYRILYFFHGATAVLSHGFVKKKAKVPDKEIDAAIARREVYRKNPERHTYEVELS